MDHNITAHPAPANITDMTAVTVPSHKTDRDDDSLYKNANPNRITTSAPEEGFRLGYFDVMCLIFNRMIGTGIFISPQRVIAGTRSTGAALMLWFFGIVYCLAGTHVYVEYGLNVPRYRIRGVEQAVPRSGGDLNYLSYVFRRPAYRKDTVLLVPTVFAVAFIVLGNVAGNSMQFATRVLLASGWDDPPPNGTVRGIAVASAVFACFIHAFSRRGGILLNNVLAVVKVCILVLIVATAIAVGAGAFGTPNVSAANMSAATSFTSAGSSDAYGYVRAFLSVVFSFSGFEQPNYVLGEIARPRRKYPVGAITGVGIVVTLYMLVNIAYMVVVPREDQLSSPNVALRFFELTYGRISSDRTAGRLFNAFLAISSIGNVIVMTYTAARVKQEIAKEGILPFAKFFAQNTDLSLGRLLNWLRARGRFAALLRHAWLSPSHHTERTPVGALCLHFAFCIVLILATYGLAPDDAYTLMTTLTAYVVNCFFGALVGIGILVLRFRGPPPTPAGDDDNDPAAAPEEKPTWRAYAGRRFPQWLSIACAALFALANLYPVVATWVPPSAAYLSRSPLTHQWWLIPVIAWSVLALGAAWWLGFLTVARREERRSHHVFVIERKPNFGAAGRADAEGGDDDGYVLLHETVYLSWVGKEAVEAGGTTRQRAPRALAGTDFEGYYG